MALGGTFLILHKFVFQSNVILSLWLTVNIILAAYQYLILTHRHRISRSYCLNPFVKFWSRNDYSFYEKQFWLDAWKEYSCTIDSRFMNPSSFVYVLTNLHIIIVICMLVIIVIVPNPKKYIIMLLAIQAINTALYIASLFLHHYLHHMVRIRAFMIFPFIWLVFPLLLVYSLYCQ